MILILYYCSFVVEKNPVDRPAGERGGIRNVIVGTLLMPVERRPCEGLCHILILYYCRYMLRIVEARRETARNGR